MNALQTVCESLDSPHHVGEKSISRMKQKNLPTRTKAQKNAFLLRQVEIASVVVRLSFPSAKGKQIGSFRGFPEAGLTSH
jgi:hypothetical protein